MNNVLNKKKYKILIISLISIFFTVTITSILLLTKVSELKKSIRSQDKSRILDIANKKNKFISTTLNHSLSLTLDAELNLLAENFKNKTISEEKYLELLSTYKELNLRNDTIDTTISSLPSAKIAEEKLKSGIDFFNKKSYYEALDIFEKIGEHTPAYEEAKNYMNKTLNKIAETTFNQTEALIKNTNYTEALKLLNESKEKLKEKEPKELEGKINEVKTLRMQHLYEYSKKSIENDINDGAKLKPYFGKLTKDNVNEFDIESKTNRFVFTDIQQQKTYIFKGSNKNWILEKEFLCSTGIDNKETIVGYFEISTKAPWFFSPKYGQGGKNYVQFKGNYLYHSIPLDSTQTTVLDYTLGEPASHGCIRLGIDDSKWLYDNVTQGTTVLIF